MRFCDQYFKTFAFVQTLTIEVSAHFSLITMSLKCAICGEMKVKHGPNGFYPSEWKKWSEGTSRCKPCYDAQELSGTSEAGLTCSMLEWIVDLRRILMSVPN